MPVACLCRLTQAYPWVIERTTDYDIIHQKLESERYGTVQCAKQHSSKTDTALSRQVADSLAIDSHAGPLADSLVKLGNVVYTIITHSRLCPVCQLTSLPVRLRISYLAYLIVSDFANLSVHLSPQSSKIDNTTSPNFSDSSGAP